MNAIAVQKIRQLKDHRVANDAIGDRKALDKIWDEAGYWFFRDVLDHDSVAEAKQSCVDGLIKLGFVDKGSREPIWNGKDLKEFPDGVGDVMDREIFRRFVEYPKNKAFFESVLDDTLIWLPMDYVRMKNPYSSRRVIEDPIEGRHQDAYGTHGLRFVTCWVPLMDIDPTVGGLTLAEGFHKNGLVVKDHLFPRIQAGVVPEDSWRYSDWHPGDVVIFHPTTPHSGLANYSNLFRLSMDLRVMRTHDANIPLIGPIKRMDEKRVVIEDEGGRGEVGLVLDENTYCCIRGNAPLTKAEAVELMPPGKLVMALEHEGHALVLRPYTNFEAASYEPVKEET